MPPVVSRKRLRGSDEDEPPNKSVRKTGKKTEVKKEEGENVKLSAKTPSKKEEKKLPVGKRKPTLYDSLDASFADTGGLSPGQILRMKNRGNENESEDLTFEDNGDMFEDVVMIKGESVKKEEKGTTDGNSGSEDEESDDEPIFEDVHVPLPDFDDQPEETKSKTLELTLRKDNRISLMNTGQKKGPTKRARRARILTHCMHVQFLMWHNSIRNAWACDEEVQAILISHIPLRMWDEIDWWREASGLNKSPPTKSKPKGKRDKGKSTINKAIEALEKTQQRDPLPRLLQSLVSWWKQRFRITAPGLRKRGYMDLHRIDALEKGWKINRRDFSKFGERIENLGEFRVAAMRLEGSRDLGAQLFTALMRGLGMEARLVGNLAVLGYGWNKLEEAEPERDGEYEIKAPDVRTVARMVKAAETGIAPAKGKPKAKAGPKAKPPAKSKGKELKKETPRKRNPSLKAQTTATVIANSEDSELSDPSSDSDSLAMSLPDNDQEAVTNVDLSITHAAEKDLVKFDADLAYPVYWTEILSPVTGTWLPVDAMVKKVIGMSRGLIETLEPRGQKADKMRQQMGYVVGYNADGTAKDVTVRYLKGQVFPGRAKGVRLRVEKIAVRDRHGRIKRYDEFDWFKRVMSCFERGNSDRAPPITEADTREDSTDLKPAIPEKKEVKEGEETLAYFKSSPDFVLARHLKREEALPPHAEPVRMFKTKAKGIVTEEPVYRRSDMVQVKSAETWHKQGRAPIPGEVPLKMVPFRAATTNRRRELAEAEARTGEKVFQGLYGFEQTDWIIPEPIKDGVIPKNSYGNIDLFAAHMCPEGAIHVPHRGAVRACKKLQIDYAEAVVDFEFGHRMAAPVISGVVIAEENYGALVQQIAIDEAERQCKKDEKRRKLALAGWRRLLKGLRIVERVRKEYGDEVLGRFTVFGRSHTREEDLVKEKVSVEMGEGGGFIPEGFEEVLEEGKDGQKKEDPLTRSAFFPTFDDDDNDDGDGGLEIVHDTDELQRGNEEDDGGEDEGGGFIADDDAPGGGFVLDKPEAKATEIPDSDDDSDELSSVPSETDEDFKPVVTKGSRRLTRKR